MKSIVFLTLCILALGSAAHAAVSPELDSGTLTVVISAITGLTLGYRMIRGRQSK
jgi:hypothetical protein